MKRSRAHREPANALPNPPPLRGGGGVVVVVVGRFAEARPVVIKFFVVDSCGFSSEKAGASALTVQYY